MRVPELDKEIDRLRQRKLDLENIIAEKSQQTNHSYSADEIEAALSDLIKNFDPKEAVKQLVQKYTPMQTALVPFTLAYIKLVLVTGLEPVRYCYRGILSPLRLPVPPHQPNENYYSIGKMKKQLFFLENLTVKGLF